MGGKERKHKNHRQITRRRNITIFSVAVISIVIMLTAIILWPKTHTEVQESNTIATKKLNGKESKKFTSEDVRMIMGKYYSSLEKGTFNADEYFNTVVFQYITLKNTSPHIINENYRKDRQEYADPKISVINNQINFIKTLEEIDYYTFSINYKCYRPSRRKHQECVVDVEVGVNNLGKITSYKELKINDLKFI